MENGRVWVWVWGLPPTWGLACVYFTPHLSQTTIYSSFHSIAKSCEQKHGGDPLSALFQFLAKLNVVKLN